MNPNISWKMSAANYRFSIEVMGALAVFSVFLIGVGRFTVVIAYAAYLLLRALSFLVGFDKRVFLIFIPISIVTLSFDIIKGPMLPVYTENHLLVSLVSMLIIENFVKIIGRKIICKFGNGEIFTVCPSCSYDNENLVGRCINCDYSFNGLLITTRQKISPLLKGDKVNPRSLSLLSLEDNEEITFHKKISGIIAVFKNGKKIIRKHLFITTKNIVFLDYFTVGSGVFYHSSWRERDIISCFNVVAIEGLMKSRYMANEPYLVFKTSSGDIYEISFSHYGKYMEEIPFVSQLVAKENQKIDVKMNLMEKPWKTINEKSRRH